MAENQILTFAGTDTGTNLLTQAEYVSDTQRPIGNQPGIARSKLVNKALRQSSLLAAGLAEFIADYQANNVTDSLTPQNIADYLLAAIQANIPVVPDASTVTKGKVQLATASEAQLYADTLKAITPATLNQAFMGSNQLMSNPGYQKLPGGMIWQFGVDTVNNSKTITFPIAFPNNIFSISAVVDYYMTPAGDEFAQVGNVTKTSFLANPRSINHTPNGLFWWMAIGN